MMNRTWQDNAEEFGALTRQGKDPRLALLVACSVEPGTGQGAPRRERDKVSARDFAERAGTTADRILRHLALWDKVAAAGLVTPSSDLTPADVTRLDVVDVALEALRAGSLDSKGGGDRPGAQKVQDIRNNPKATAAALADPAFLDKVLDADPTVTRAVERVVNDRQDAAYDHERRRAVPVERNPMDAFYGLRLAAQEVETAVRNLSTRGLPTGDSRVILEGYAQRLRAGLDFLDTMLTGGGITDASLEAFLAGGDR